MFRRSKFHYRHSGLERVQYRREDDLDSEQLKLIIRKHQRKGFENMNRSTEEKLNHARQMLDNVERARVSAEEKQDELDDSVDDDGEYEFCLCGIYCGNLLTAPFSSAHGSRAHCRGFGKTGGWTDPCCWDS